MVKTSVTDWGYCMNMSYERLIADHDAIDKLAYRIEAKIEEPEPDAAGTEALLGDPSLAVSEHLAVEDRSVYAPLVGAKHDKPWRSEVDFEAALQELRADWQTYLADWVVTDKIKGDWPAFAEETRAMMARLRQRVRDETDLIYPMAMQRGYIRLREFTAKI